ncbi:MAG: hypothetical protein ACLPKB_05860 [Xanthobacteraceae bacterium]
MTSPATFTRQKIKLWQGLARLDTIFTGRCTASWRTFRAHALDKLAVLGQMAMGHELKFPDLSKWLNVPSDLGQELSKPTPLGSLAASLILVLTIVALITMYRFIRRLWGSRKGSRFERFIVWFDNFERGVIGWLGYIVGTRYRWPWVRALVCLTFFGTSAVAAALLRWPWCLWAISIGLLGVVVIFRQWSHDEDDEEYYIKSRKRFLVNGDRTFEVIIACASVFV